MHFSLITKIVLFGSPSRKSNSRINFSSVSLPSKYARQYIDVCSLQLKKIKNNKLFPIKNPDYYWVFDIYYSNKKSDASIELLFDILQKEGIVINDNIIREYKVNAKKFDKITPRAIISIYEVENENIE